MKQLFLVAMAVIGLAAIVRAQGGVETAVHCAYTGYYNDQCSFVMNGTNYTVHKCESGLEGDCGFVN